MPWARYWVPSCLTKPLRSAFSISKSHYIITKGQKKNSLAATMRFCLKIMFKHEPNWKQQSHQKARFVKHGNSASIKHLFRADIAFAVVGSVKHSFPRISGSFTYNNTHMLKSLYSKVKAYWKQMKSRLFLWVWTFTTRGLLYRTEILWHLKTSRTFGSVFLCYLTEEIRIVSHINDAQ